MKSDFMMALNQLSAERGLRKDLVLGKVEIALATAFRRDSVAGAKNLSVKLDPNTGEISIYPLITVVDEVEDDETQIILDDARLVAPDAEVGAEIALDKVPYDNSRITAQTARQVLIQGLREAEREKIFDEYSSYQGEIISGSVDSVERGRRVVYINLNPHQAQNQRARGVMRPEDQVGNERYRKGQNIKVLLVEVAQTARGPEVVVSRSHRDLLRRLMEAEVPEIGNGTVEIRAVARDPGVRSKVAVFSRQDGVDPVGSCIGLRGNRIQSIVNELQGEKIDVIEWDSNPSALIARALSPADVGGVELDPEERTAYVVVPETQMSLAIGRDGQNARLAARLTGWRLDIKNVEQWEALKAVRAADEEARRAAEQATLEQQQQAAALAGETATDADVAAAETPADDGADVLLPAATAAAAALTETRALAETAAAAPAAEPDTETPAPATDAAAATPAPAAATPAPTRPEPDQDEDALIDALIAEEEAAAAVAAVAALLESEPEPAAETEPELQPQAAGISVDTLENLTIDDVVPDAEDEEEEELEEEDFDDDIPDLLASLPTLSAPDAGKIRFAEDIVGNFRGGEGRRRRGGGNRRGGNVPGARGPGPRRR